MTSDVPLDYAIFQLSPRRSRCELFVSYDGNTEKLASGLVKPFVSHLKVVEEQVASVVESIKLEVEQYTNAEAWFTKGTLERFVRFVSTPEVLEMVSTFDAEMSQLEVARRIYSQGVGGNQSKESGGDEAGEIATSDITKKELLRAIDVRLAAVKQDLTSACNHALAAGFSPESVSELRHFADHFGAHRLSEACNIFIELSQKRQDLFSTNSSNNLTWKSLSDTTLRSSTSSDMSLDSPSGDHPKMSTSKVTFPLRRFSREPSPMNEPDVRENIDERDNDKDKVVGPTTSNITTTSTSEADSLTQSSQTPKLTRRLSVQERISLFESKQKEISPSTSTTPKPDLRSLPSDASLSEKAVLRRWSGASDMSIDVSFERTEVDSNSKTPTPTSSSSNHHVLPLKSRDQVDLEGVSKLPVGENFGSQSAVFSGTGSGSGSDKPVSSELNSKIPSLSTRLSDNSSLKDISPSSNQTSSVQTQFKSLAGKTDDCRKDVETLDGHQRVEDNEVKDQSVANSHFKSTQRRRFGVDQESTDSEFRAQSVIENKEKTDSEPFEKQAGNLSLQTSGSSRSKLQGHGSVSERMKKTWGGRKERSVDTEGVVSSTFVEPMDQVQKMKQPKGNQELNDELKIKANELEKLFAEHKLRVPADQSNSARRTWPAEAEVLPPQLKIVGETTSGSSNMKFNSTPLMKSIDNRDFDVTPKHNIDSLSFSDDSRGKLYQKYMRKRDAKLREDWSVRRPEKEAKMKAMQDSLEKSRVEMMSKLAGSADKSNYVHDSGRRVEKLKLFNVRSANNREQASSTPRNSALPAPRSSGKGSNSIAGRRRFNSDNPLAQSVPNFSDLKKENTKPSFAGSKPGRSQARNHAGKKNSSEDLSLIHKEKPRISQSLKKSGSNPMELNDSYNYIDVYEKEENKGSIGSRSQASLMMEAVRNGHDLDDMSFETEEMTDATKDEDDEYENTMGGESVNLDNHSNERRSLESEFENSDSFRFSQARPASVTELPSSMSSLFRSMGSIQDSPGESLESWNLRGQNPFSFPHEVTDVDASDSPIGSPTSWNFHMVGSIDADAARMRNKWGEAQKPMVGTDSSHSRKDVTKGLKRFLKFGRKNRASESSADWVSATTSEGDDDTEDGRDHAYRSSEDLRKSRMGFSHSHHSDEGFNENDFFNEQVSLQSTNPTAATDFKLRDEHLSGTSLKAPKSFFSLSNFRSKGNDSKLR